MLYPAAYLSYYGGERVDKMPMCEFSVFVYANIRDPNKIAKSLKWLLCGGFLSIFHLIMFLYHTKRNALYQNKYFHMATIHGRHIFAKNIVENLLISIFYQ